MSKKSKCGGCEVPYCMPRTWNRRVWDHRNELWVKCFSTFRRVLGYRSPRKPTSCGLEVLQSWSKFRRRLNGMQVPLCRQRASKTRELTHNRNKRVHKCLLSRFTTRWWCGLSCPVAAGRQRRTERNKLVFAWHPLVARCRPHERQTTQTTAKSFVVRPERVHMDP